MPPISRKPVYKDGKRVGYSWSYAAPPVPPGFGLGRSLRQRGRNKYLKKQAFAKWRAFVNRRKARVRLLNSAFRRLSAKNQAIIVNLISRIAAQKRH